MDSLEIISKNILFFMLKKEYSRLELANEASINQDTVGGIINCTQDPKLSTLNKIAEALDVPFYHLAIPQVDYIFYHEGKEVNLNLVDEYIKTLERLKELQSLLTGE